MEKCRLCLIKDTDDTGSHVVPHFLLKRIFNVANVKGRDQEISFKLTAINVESHFGRSVQPEKLEEVFGELTEEELLTNATADLVVDNEWCTSCEKKFADLEGFYAKTLEISKDVPYQSTKDSLAAMMFWLSILWRASKTNSLGCEISDKEEKKVRQLLDGYSFGEPNEGFLEKYKVHLDEICYKVFRSADYSKKRGTFLYMGKVRQPYSLIIDEFVIMFYLRKRHLGLNKQCFFGYEKLINVEENTYLKAEMIHPLTFEVFGTRMDEFVEFIKRERLQIYENTLNKLYREIGNKGVLPDPIKNEIFYRITDEETQIGRKYTYEDFVKCTTEVFLKHHIELRQIKRYI